MTEKEMWSRFCTETSLDPKTPYEAWAFCGGGPYADELAALVLSGTKTATASAFVAFETEGEPLPPEAWKTTAPERYESFVETPTYMILKLGKR